MTVSHPVALYESIKGISLALLTQEKASGVIWPAATEGKCKEEKGRRQTLPLGRVECVYH